MLCPRPPSVPTRRCSSHAPAGALLASTLDEVAWLTNLRGGDVMCNPVFISYA